MPPDIKPRRFPPPWSVEELNTEPPWWWRTEVLALMAAMTYEGRLELLAAAVVGAALGFVTGYVLGKPLLAILIWALIGALVVAGLVYCFRVLRGRS
jgi:hypothetical protein